MRKKLFQSIPLSLLLLMPGLCSFAQLPQLGKDPVKKVVEAMTLEEKAGMVVGAGMRFQGNQQAEEIQVPVIGMTQNLVMGAAGTSYAVPRLGVVPMVYADGPAGLRISPTRENDQNTYYCTAFPVATLLASTWDVDLVYNVGKAMGSEVLEYGADVLLAPGMNIQRNPLCGRNFEYYSEDPYVTGKMAAAMVNGVESNGVGTSIKHYVANNAETNRNTLDTYIGERALREIYLEGWRIAVEESQPWTVMSSYNLLNGVYTSESHDLLTKILRDDMGFEGFVMTDWGGGIDPVAQMNAGNDLIMPGNPRQSNAIIEAVKSGKLDEKVLDLNVERILNIMLLSPRYKGFPYTNKPDLDANAEVTRQAATEGMVLLKNDKQALPFGENIKNIAAFGNTSYEIITGGTGSGDVNEAYSVSLVEGLQNVGFTVNKDLESLYNQYLSLTKAGKSNQRWGFFMRTPTPELTINQDIVNGMANTADAAIVTIGRNSGEGRDRTSGEGDFLLTQDETALISMVCKAFGEKEKKVVVILNVGGAIETLSWRDIPDAILLAWQAGQETGNSIADILCGKVNPSGKLAVTFPGTYEDVPSAQTFPGIELPVPEEEKPEEGARPMYRRRPAEVVYEDGIYVGYRYYETFAKLPAYEFGYGLSFTSFDYENLKLSSKKFGKSIIVTVDVKNTGSVAGKEVVQLYLTAPSGELDKPAIELKGFAKTRLLKPGEVQSLRFTIVPHNLASFDPAVSSWVADAGTYEVKVGASSKDIRQKASFTLAKKTVVDKETPALKTDREINELKAPK